MSPGAMWGVLKVLAACYVAGSAAETSGGSVGVRWCSPFCLCRVDTGEEQFCFQRSDILSLVDIPARIYNRLEMNGILLEDIADWCSGLCLCNKKAGSEFKCTTQDVRDEYIFNALGENFFYQPEQTDDEEAPLVHETEEESPEQRKRAERRKNKRNRKHRKNKSKPTPEEETPQPEPTPSQAPSTTTTTPTPSQAPSTTTTSTMPSHHDLYPEGEPLPRQEAVAASPAITALQPPTRREPFSTMETFTPRLPPREVEVFTPRVQPVLETSGEKETLALWESHALHALEDAVREVRGDVVFNQQVLFATVAVAAIAMLGVVVLAIVGCSRRRQAPPAPASREPPRDDNHVTKLNVEEAW